MQHQQEEISCRIKDLTIVFFSRVILMFMLLLAVNSMTAAAGEAVVVQIGGLRVVEPGFSVTGVRVANDAILQVERFDNNKLRILGKNLGQSDVQVVGDDGDDKTYSVRVVPDNEALLRAVRRDLDGIHEVEIYENLGRVVIKGEMNNPRDWAIVQKVVEAYGGQILNLASFRPGPGVILNLQKALQVAGFEVITDGSNVSHLPPNTLLVLGGQDGVRVSGFVYSKNQLEQIRRIVAGQPYLALIAEQKEVKEGQLPAVVEVKIEPVMLELDVYFAVVSDKDTKQIGVNLAKEGLIMIDTTAALFSGTVGSGDSAGLSGSYVINSGLAGALKFFQGSGPGRTFSAGHMTFKNYADDWKKFHSGGTLKVKVTSSDSAELVDIDYGLMIKTKGGLLDKETADLDLVLELSNPVGNEFGDYDVKRDTMESSVQCPLGKTLVMGGAEKLMENFSKDGVPILRDIPLINFFFSEKTQKTEKMHLLILISPQLAPGAVAARPASDRTKGTFEKSQQPLKHDGH